MKLAGGLLATLALWLSAFPAPAAEEAATGEVPARLREPDFRELLEPTPVTRAVDRGLEYLKGSQLADGSWLSPAYGKNTGVASLATLAILSAGHEAGRGPFGDCIEQALRYVLSEETGGLLAPRDNRQRSHGPLYEHGITTLLLGEVIGMVNPDRPGLQTIHRTHRNAVNLILRAQNVPKRRGALGGWRYNPDDTDSDISVTGWQLLALRAAEEAGLPIPGKNIRQAVLYIKRCQQPSGGFGYMPGPGYEPNVARTGTGVLALQLCGEHDSPESTRGGDWLLKHPLEWKAPFFYYSVYYSNQAMYQLGGAYWETWRRRTESLLLQHQSDDGSWPAPPRETHEQQAGPAYTTALAILSLTVDYKYLPIYQR